MRMPADLLQLAASIAHAGGAQQDVAPPHHPLPQQSIMASRCSRYEMTDSGRYRNLTYFRSTAHMSSLRRRMNRLCILHSVMHSCPHRLHQNALARPHRLAVTGLGVDPPTRPIGLHR